MPERNPLNEPLSRARDRRARNRRARTQRFGVLAVAITASAIGVVTSALIHSSPTGGTPQITPTLLAPVAIDRHAIRPPLHRSGGGPDPAPDASEGPQGEKGDPGPQGERGSRGPKGDPGGSCACVAPAQPAPAPAPAPASPAAPAAPSAPIPGAVGPGALIQTQPLPPIGVGK